MAKTIGTVVVGQTKTAADRLNVYFNGSDGQTRTDADRDVYSLQLWLNTHHLESVKIAAMADVYEVNVAPHNFYGHLASVISAHFCAAVPNFRIMEIDIDGVPWRDDIVNAPPVIENGDFILPKGPGWGIEVNEAGLRAHPVKQ